jgi:hypothetical protein
MMSEAEKIVHSAIEILMIMVKNSAPLPLGTGAILPDQIAGRLR